MPVGESTDKVCGEAPRLATEKEDVENDASVCFSIGFVLRSKELLLLSQGIKSPRSFIDAVSHVRTIREIRSNQTPKVREFFDKRANFAASGTTVTHHYHPHYKAKRSYSANSPNFNIVLHRVCVRAVRVGKQARARRAEVMLSVHGEANWAPLSIRNHRDSVQHDKLMATTPKYMPVLYIRRGSSRYLKI